jgi:hypothetical protein
MLFFQKKSCIVSHAQQTQKQNKPSIMIRKTKEIQTKKNNTKNNEQKKCINIEIKHINIFFYKHNKQKEELKETMNNKNTYKHIKKQQKIK